MKDYQISHIAFSDESCFNDGIFRSISLLTLEVGKCQEIENDFFQVLSSSGITELRWQKLRQARDRIAAIKIIDRVILRILAKELRIDILIWDIKDSRSNVKGRDDNANLLYMYRYLYINVLHKRWIDTSIWKLCPDENSLIDWKGVHQYLNASSQYFKPNHPSLPDLDSTAYSLVREFNIQEIIPVKSKESSICQVADFFAGIGAYSHRNFNKYNNWLKSNNGQEAIDFSSTDEEEILSDNVINRSNSEENRFIVINYLNNKFKQLKLGVGLEKSKGFKTYDPKNPINFWIYQPQTDLDKAPTKIH
ncbi:MAG: DUF3800 domain-containing protein [Candidatus Atribacteria bacterium]|nr:DUF3800 domain-containing protein [Candidatus Atribacteria bacterium]